jgi:hypothetical protein
MKIKLSKRQWEFIGKKAGWVNLPEADPENDEADVVEEKPSTVKNKKCKDCGELLSDDGVRCMQCRCQLMADHYYRDRDAIRRKNPEINWRNLLRLD